ncbi:MAG: type I restriction-modification system subunit M N-terminal domain-containing protein [Allorhizobium sp.]|uniref:type I restriction-modification system subunit M N-terminal domain-containing protein n=1 Tax=Allorhizobium sp. TaxID=633478 RepID=UPI0040339DBB
MTSAEQRAELQRRIWQIANEVRGAVDGWDFKQFVLGTLFYRFISENFASYMEADDESLRPSRMKRRLVRQRTVDFCCIRREFLKSRATSLKTSGRRHIV